MRGLFKGCPFCSVLGNFLKLLLFGHRRPFHREYIRRTCRSFVVSNIYAKQVCAAHPLLFGFTPFFLSLLRFVSFPTLPHILCGVRHSSLWVATVCWRFVNRVAVCPVGMIRQSSFDFVVTIFQRKDDFFVFWEVHLAHRSLDAHAPVVDVIHVVKLMQLGYNIFPTPCPPRMHLITKEDAWNGFRVEFC